MPSRELAGRVLALLAFFPVLSVVPPAVGVVILAGACIWWWGALGRFLARR